MWQLQRSVAVLQSKLDPNFLSLQLISPRCIDYYNTQAKGTAQKGIYLGKLGLMEMLVPPLQEQQRIVAKIDELFSICDSTSNRLKKSEKLKNLLSETIIKKAI